MKTQKSNEALQGRIDQLAVELESYRRRLEDEVSERKRFEEALRESNKRMEAILYSLPAGILIIDITTQRIVRANPQAVLLLGVPIGQIVGSNCNRFIPLPEGEPCSIDAPKMSGTPERRFLLTGGEQIPVHLSAISARIDNCTCLVLSFVGIGEQKRPGHERIRNEKLRGVIEMAGAVCHELNQPMMAVSGYSELAMMDLKDDDPAYGTVEKIKAQVDRMGAITRKLMGVIRCETVDCLEGKIIDIRKAAD